MEYGEKKIELWQVCFMLKGKENHGKNETDEDWNMLTLSINAHFQSVKLSPSIF